MTTSNARWVSLLAIVIMVFLAFGSTDDDNASSPATYKANKTDAWIMAEKFVNDRLKAPGTADYGSVFGEYQDPKVCVSELGENRFRCRGWVDAENAFGAKLRQRFDLTLNYTESDQKWRLESFEFLEW